MISIVGYPPGSIQFCPECGQGNIEFSDHWNNGTGLLKCPDCDLECYIVEGTDSHKEDSK